MSQPLPGAAVTATLHKRLTPVTSDVTALPLDKAEPQTDGKRLNLFLYLTTVNAARRNGDMPPQAKPNETSFPPLALNLYYLLTAFSGPSGDEITNHALLGN